MKAQILGTVFMHVLNRAISLVTMVLVLSAVSAPLHAYGNPNDTLDESIDLYESNRFKNASDSLEKLVKSRVFRKLDSLEKSLALSYLIDSKLMQGKARAAMAHTGSLLKVSKSGFGELSEEYVDAHYIKAKVQYHMGDERDSSRTLETMVNILDRMGDDYRKSVQEARKLASRVKSNEWDQEELIKDLSEFYSECESIEDGVRMTIASGAMSEFLLVGSEYKPKGRIKRWYKNTYLKHARENMTDRANRIIYIPDTENLDHWCVVYPGERGLVDRAVTSSPEY